MAADKIAATLLKPQVNTNTDASPTWVDIKGVNNVEANPSAENVDATDYDSPGWSQDRVVSRGLSFTVAGFYLVDTGTTARDPGQAAVSASGKTVAGETNNIRQYRLLKSWGGAITFHATAVVTEGAGGPAKGLAPFQAVLSCTDKPVET